MSPSELSWFQGCLFLFLGVVGGYGLNRCQSRRTDRGSSDAELSSIRVENEIATTPYDDAQTSGGDEEARSPSNLSNPIGEAMASTGSRRWPNRNRLRSNSRRRPRGLLKPSAKTRKTSRFLEFVAETEAPNFARRETAYSTIVADTTSSPMSSPTARLLRSSGGEDEVLLPSHPVGEALALPGTPSCRDRKRCRSNSCMRMNAPENRTKRPFKTFEKFIIKDESQNVSRLEPVNMVVADSFSTSMASTTPATTAVNRPPRRHFVPRPSREIPSVDHLQASTFDGLRRRKRRNGLFCAEIRVPNSKGKCLGNFHVCYSGCLCRRCLLYYEMPLKKTILHNNPAMIARLPPMPAGLNDKDKVVFVRDQAKWLRSMQWTTRHPRIL